MKIVKESDWKIFKELHKTVLARFCEGILKEASKITESTSANPHHAYVELYRLIHDKDKLIARLFNDFRRSTAMLQLKLMDEQLLLTKDEKALFSAEVQNWLNLNFSKDFDPNGLEFD